MRLGSPPPATAPSRSHNTSSHIFSTRPREWVTSRMVRPRRRNSPILSRHLRVKASSPTASTSSISSTSGSTLMATAKPSRAYMPEE
jgi:hypothetical protein